MSIGYTSVPSKRNAPNGRWYQSVTRDLNSSRLTAGQGIRLTQTPTGTTISATAGTGSNQAVQVVRGVSARTVMAKVLEGSTEAGYNIQCYPNYPSEEGRFNAVAFVPSIAFGTLSLSGEWTGKWVLAHYVGLRAIGGA